MKNVMVVLGLVLAAISVQASAATLSWGSITGVNSGLLTKSEAPSGQQLDASVIGIKNSIVKTVKGKTTTVPFKVEAKWGFHLSDLSNIHIDVSSNPGQPSWLEAKLYDSADHFIDEIDVNGDVYQHLLNGGDYVIKLEGKTPTNGAVQYSLGVQTPIPAAVWLFGSAFAGLMGAVRRKAA